MEKLNSIDLFAGVGGMRLGFEKSGFETVFANDSNIHCKDTYDMNFNKPKLETEDIWKVDINDIPNFDILCAGFPCQAFSIAGYRKGFKDDKGRGNLFFRIVEILKHKKPKAIFLENVKNLKSHDNGNTFKVIIKALEKLGYHTKSEILNSMTHGNIPQNRERIFIVGFLNKKNLDEFNFPNKKPLKKDFRNFISNKVDKKYYYENKPLYQKIKKDVNSENTVFQWRRKYVRSNKKGVVPTLTANMGTGGHNVPIIKTTYGIRKLTPKECFLLQGFPKNFKLPSIADSKLYQQSGNTVCVPLITRIGKNIKSALDS